MIGSMAALPCPRCPTCPLRPHMSALELDALHDTLFRDHAIEVPVPPRAPRTPDDCCASRAACDELEDYERLAEALRKIARSG